MLWIKVLYSSQKQKFEVESIFMMYLFLTNSSLLIKTLIDWSREDCYCFYRVFGLFLTAPIHCRGYITEQVMQFQICSDEETNSFTSSMA